MQLQMIADQLSLELHGDPSLQIESLASVANAGPQQLTFVVGARWIDALKATRAGAVILPPSLLENAPCSALVSKEPYLSYAQATHILHPDVPPSPGVHKSAIVAADAKVSDTAQIAEYAVIKSGAQIGDQVYVGPGCVVGEDARIGARCYLHANVTLYHQCQIGTDCRLHTGVVIGADGFGYAPSSAGWSRIKQLGRVVIGNQVEIGANTTIDRGALDDTIIGDGVILDNQIQIAHNVQIGEHTAIAACVGIAGSTHIGKRCTIGGKTAIVGHLSIADDVHLTATSFVTQSIKSAGSYSSGMPLQPTRQWRRTYARLNRLEQWVNAVKNLTNQSVSR